MSNNVSVAVRMFLLQCDLTNFMNKKLNKHYRINKIVNTLVKMKGKREKSTTPVYHIGIDA